MKWRKISEQEVEAVISAPEKVEPTERGRMNAFRRSSSRYLKVTYREFPDEIFIISVVDKRD